MSKNEDYLDQLLNQFTKSGRADSEEQLNQLSQKIEIDTKDDVPPARKNTEDDFIRQFESEMDEFNSERLISEFEMELDQTTLEPEEDPLDSDFFSGLNEVMGRETSFAKEAVKEEAVQEESVKEESVKEEVVQEEVVQEEAVQEKVPQEETFKDEIEIEDEVEQVKGEDESVDTPEIDADIKDDESGMGDKEEIKDQPLKARKQVDLDSDEDILDLLAGLSGDNEELSDIANMLKADENHEPVEADGILDMDDELKSITKEESEENLELRKTKKKKRNKKKENIKNDQDEHSVLSKLSKALFGEEEVVAEALTELPIRELDGTETPEELEIIENLKNADIVVKTKEEQEKEEKKKIAAEQKAEKAKAAQEKKKENAAKKAESKAKKAEKPAKIKAIDKTPPLPKMSVILIFLMSISFLVFILLATKGSGYQLAKNQTLAFYKEKNYVEAYSVIAGVELKEADKSLRDKVALLAGLQEEYRAQTTYFKAKKYEQALDALVRGIGRYYDGLERAKALDVVAEYGVAYAQLQESLSQNYKLTDEEALKLYKIRKRNQYSVEIIQIVEKLTFQ